MDADFANPFRVGPRDEVGISSWSLKVNDPAELPNDPLESMIAWLVGGTQGSTTSGLAWEEPSG